MKRTVCILCIIIFALSGCTGPKQDTLDVQTLALSNLHLAENQAFGVSDYYENQLLLLIYDTQKRDPREDESLQAPAKFCVKFVLYDIVAQEITEEFPLEQFGHCLSAVYAFDGVFLTWVTHTDEMEALSSISYINQQGMRKICDLSITKFSLGPLLCRMNDELVFSYTNERTDGAFGVKKITKDFNVEPLLTWNPDEVDKLSDDIAASKEHYIYAVGEQNQVTFYVGTANNTHVTFRLLEGEKLHSFGIDASCILICKSKPPSEGGGYFLERFDMNGNSIELYTLEKPLYYITGAISKYFCGFNGKTALELFEITDTIQNIKPSSNIID